MPTLIERLAVHADEAEPIAARWGLILDDNLGAKHAAVLLAAIIVLVGTCEGLGVDADLLMATIMSEGGFLFCRRESAPVLIVSPPLPKGEPEVLEALRAAARRDASK